MTHSTNLDRLKWHDGSAHRYSRDVMKEAIARISEKRLNKGGERLAIAYLEARKRREQENLSGLNMQLENRITSWCDTLIQGYAA